MRALFGFTVRQILWERKLCVTLVLLAGPCALTLLIRHFETHVEFEKVWIRLHAPAQVMFVLVLPMICMLCGTSLIGSEVEGRTLVYLLTRKKRRPTVLLVRFAAAAVVLASLVDLALSAQYFCAVGGLDLAPLEAYAPGGVWRPGSELWCYLTVAPLGVLAFLAVFMLIGLLTAKPLSVSILYLIVVELLIAALPVGARVYTVAHQLRLSMFNSIPGLPKIYELPPEQTARFFPPGSTGTAALCGVVLVALLFSCVLMTTRELVPSKVARE